MIEVGNYVEVRYWDLENGGPELTVKGVLVDYRVGWLRVRPDQGEPVTVVFPSRVLRDYWPVSVRKVERES